jgi:hypothetical protein
MSVGGRSSKAQMLNAITAFSILLALASIIL